MAEPPLVLDGHVIPDDVEAGQRLYKTADLEFGLRERLKVAFDLGAPQELAWYLPPTTENSRLLHHINFFFQRLRDSGELARLEEQMAQILPGDLR